MLDRIIRIIITIIGLLFGVGIAIVIDNFGIFDFISIEHGYIYILFGIIFGLLFFKKDINSSKKSLSKYFINLFLSSFMTVIKIRKLFLYKKFCKKHII